MLCGVGVIEVTDNDEPGEVRGGAPSSPSSRPGARDRVPGGTGLVRSPSLRRTGTGGARQGAGRPARPCPDDFDLTFVRIGRLECEEHYGAGDNTITRWLTERGKDRLKSERAEFVRDQRAAKAAARKQKLTRSDMQRILEQVYPQPRTISFTLATGAAHFLRAVRNGGWIVTRAGDGLWWVGARKRTAAELVALAEAKGFGSTLSAESDEQ